VFVSIRRLILPFVSAAEDRSATITAARSGLSEESVRAFDMPGNMLSRIHNVNTTKAMTDVSLRAALSAAPEPHPGVFPPFGFDR
jgi:hypothetical protein